MQFCFSDTIINSMFQDKTVGVVVPAYNEEKFIGKVIDTMPDFVDKIVIINDKSTDKTGEIIEEYSKKDSRVVPVHNDKNRGNGGALISGYLRALELELDVVAVMDGDGQMDPDDLFNIVLPVIWGEVDYTKGNRLLEPNVWQVMPRYRFWGNSLLTLLTKFATGYWHLLDPQFSYTAISKRTLSFLPIQNMTAGYAYNADILNMLNLASFKVKDVPAKSIYSKEQKTRIKLRTYIPKICYLLPKLFLRRMIYKYVIREFHPLVFFYFLAFVNLVLISIPLAVRFFYLYYLVGEAPRTTLTILTFTIMMGFFSFIFGMWLDMEDNKRLTGK